MTRQFKWHAQSGWLRGAFWGVIKRENARLQLRMLLMTLMLTRQVIRATPTATASETEQVFRPQLLEEHTAAQQQQQQQQSQLFANISTCCSSRECSDQLNRQHLLTLQSYMNTRADPCHDFHAYACGSWSKEHKNSTTTVKLADAQLTQKFVELFERWLLEEEQVLLNDTMSRLNEVQRNMLIYYKTCRKLENVEKLTLQAYLKGIHEHDHLWQQQHFDWLHALAVLGRYGYSSHFLRHVVVENASYAKLLLMPHDENKQMVWNEELSAALKEYATPLAKERGMAELRSVLQDFERRLLSMLKELHSNDSIAPDEAEMLADDSESDDKNVERVQLTLLELIDATGGNMSLDWVAYLSTILARHVEPTETVLVEKLTTLKAVLNFLQHEPVETLQLYTLARFLRYLQELSKPNFLHANINASRHNCVKHMRKHLYLPMNYLYELEYYSKVRARSDPVIIDIFRRLKQEFSHVLRENAMNLSSNELDYLLQKLTHMRINIGNLPLKVTHSYYSDYVHNLHINTHSFTHNHLHALQHFFAQKYLLVGLQDQQLNLVQHSFVLNGPNFPDDLDITPFFYCLSNMILIPSAYLQLPFYHVHFWDTLLYGDLANTLGHEIMHGFDNAFLSFDAHGMRSKRHEGIMQNTLFKQNIACLNVGTQFLQERIADVSGTHLTLRTFMQHAERKQSNERLFFLQFAQFFCGSTNEQQHHKDDPYHDIGNERLNYVLAQMPEFAEVFACPLGSKLNPETRCRMW